jgi:WD40 repeat protein
MTLTGSFDQTLRLWDMESCESRIVLKGHTGYVWGGCFCGDHLAISGSHDQKLKVWDLNVGSQVLPDLIGHRDQVFCVAAAPTASLVTSGSADKTLQVWDVRTGCCVGTMEGHKEGEAIP